METSSVPNANCSELNFTSKNYKYTHFESHILTVILLKNITVQWGYSEQFNHRLFISSSYSSRMAILASVGDHLSSLLEHLIYIWMFNCICALLSSTCTLSSIMHFIFLHNSTIKQSFHCIPNLYKTVFPYLFHEAKTTFISHLSTAILLWSHGYTDIWWP